MKRNIRRSIRRRGICGRIFRLRLLEKGKMLLQERVKAEMHQSVVEVGTGICNNIKEAKAEVKMFRRNMVRLAQGERAAAGVGGDASVFGLADAGDSS